MSAIESLIAAMLEDMIDTQFKNPGKCMFPVDKSIERNPVNMIWNVGLNAMAYGFDAGLRVSGLNLDDLSVQTANDNKEGGGAKRPLPTKGENVHE